MRSGQQHGPHRQAERRRHALPRVLAEAVPGLREAAVHAAGGERRAVHHLRPVAARAEAARQRQPVVQGAAHRAVAADRLVGGTLAQHHLPAGGGEADAVLARAPADGQVAEQQQVDGGHGQRFAERADHLARHAADHGKAPPRRVRRQRRRRVRRKAHVGVEEQQVRAPRRLGEPRAGVDLAGPARRQRRRGEQAQPRIGGGEAADDGRRRVAAAVVHHQHLDRHAAAGEGGAQAGLDVGLLVPRRNQDGDQRARRTARPPRARSSSRLIAPSTAGMAASTSATTAASITRRPPAGRAAGRKPRPRSSAPTRRQACHTPPMPRRPSSKVSNSAGSRAMLSAARRSSVAASEAAISSARAVARLGEQDGGGDRLAEGRQHLRRALVPEGVFEGERQEGRAGREFRQPAHPRRDRHRPLARVGEAPRRVDPEQMPRRRQHLRRDAQEARGAARARLHAEHAEAAHEAVPVERLRVHRHVQVALAEQPLPQQHHRHAVPPGGVVGEHHHRPVAGGSARPAPAGEAHGAQVPAGEAGEDAVEEGDAPGRAQRDRRRRRPIAGGARRATAALLRGERRARGCRSASRRPASSAAAPMPRPPRSRSSASAAIQPLIITIGMPGPGCAAPPAR